MKGLLIKDFIGMKEQAKAELIMFGLFIVMGIVFKNMMYITMVVGIRGLNILLTSVSYDEMTKWNQYSLTMPIERKDIVLSKYLFSFLNILLSTLVAIITIFIALYKRTSITATEILVTNYTIFAFITTMNILLLPIIFKYGVEKARTAILVMFGLIVALVGGVLYFIAKPDPLSLDRIIKNIVVVSPFVLALMYFISIKTSIKIVESKDY